MGHGLQAQSYVKNAATEALYICSYEPHLSMLLFYTYVSASLCNA